MINNRCNRNPCAKTSYVRSVVFDYDLVIVHPSDVEDTSIPFHAQLLALLCALKNGTGGISLAHLRQREYTNTKGTHTEESTA